MTRAGMTWLNGSGETIDRPSSSITTPIRRLVVWKGGGQRGWITIVSGIEKHADFARRSQPDQEARRLKRRVDVGAPRQLARWIGQEAWHFAGGRQPDREGAAHTYLRHHVNHTPEVSDEAMYQRKAKARAIAHAFGGEERIEHTLQHRRRDAAAGIADREARVGAGAQRAMRK